MKKLSDTYKKLGIDFAFPIEVRNAHGRPTYYENSYGDWSKREYNAQGNETYYENSDGFWCKKEYDAQGKQTYYENSDGIKSGTPRSKSCDGKVVEIDGKKYKLTEL